MEKTTITMSDLKQFTGTEQWYRHSLSRMLYTDGVQFLAEQVGAYWIIDLIGSHQPKLRNEEFQKWTIQPEGNRYAAICDDGNGNQLCKQVFPYTDFPAHLMPFKLYVQNNTLILPSEY